ncbi:MAG TPA: hypothetical protein V6C72_19955 [Chroococcales cyanobacterium]
MDSFEGVPPQALPSGKFETVDFSDKDHVEKLIHHAPSEQFLRILDNSTAEEMALLLRSMDSQSAGITTGSQSNGTNWLKRELRPIFSVEPGKRTSLAVVAWWEQRRFFFNLVVGACGLPGAIAMCLFGGSPLMVLAAAASYGFMANVCYTLGSPAEIVSRYLWREKALEIGPVLLSLGTVFSMFLTSACTVVVMFLLLVTIH